MQLISWEALSYSLIQNVASEPAKKFSGVWMNCFLKQLQSWKMTSIGSYPNAGSVLTSADIHKISMLTRISQKTLLTTFLLADCSKPVELKYLINFPPNLEQRFPHEKISAGGLNTSSKYSCSNLVNVNAAYNFPTLIDPRYILLLAKLVQKSVQLGCPQQFLKIYRWQPL